MRNFGEETMNLKVYFYECNRSKLSLKNKLIK